MKLNILCVLAAICITNQAHALGVKPDRICTSDVNPGFCAPIYCTDLPLDTFNKLMSDFDAQTSACGVPMDKGGEGADFKRLTKRDHEKLDELYARMERQYNCIGDF